MFDVPWSLVLNFCFFCCETSNIVMDEKNSKVRIRWREDSIKCFLEACIQEVSKLSRNKSSLQKDSWVRVQKQLQEMCNLKVSRKQMRNEYDYLKGKYSGWVYLKGKVGDRYDPKTNSFNLTTEEWENFLKEYPKVKKLRNSPLLFPELCAALFKKTFLLGENRWSPNSNLSKRLSSRLRNSSLAQPLQIKDIPSNGQEGGTKIISSPLIQPQPLQIAEIPSNSQEDGIQNPVSPNSQPQPLQIVEILSSTQENGIQSPESPNSQSQPLQIAEVPSNSQGGGTKILSSPIIQPQPLQIAEIPSNTQEDGIQIPGSPNIQPQPGQIAKTPSNSQGGTKNPSIQDSQSDTVVPLDDKARPSAMDSNLNGKRPKKRCKTSDKGSQLEEDMSSALRAIAKRYDGPSQDDCVEKLNQLGWATDSMSYVAALGIFCEGPSYRKGWMLLPIDNVELLKSWVQSIGRKLGYL